MSSSGLETYLKKFLVIQPGEWPCQFYCSQLVYQSFLQHSSSTDTVKGNFPPVTSLIPTMGPLHISLNRREHVFEFTSPPIQYQIIEPPQFSHLKSEKINTKIFSLLEKVALNMVKPISSQFLVHKQHIFGTETGREIRPSDQSKGF